MKQFDINVDVRKDSGKGVARKLRHTGRIPGVLYGPERDPVSLSIDSHEFNMMLQSSRGEKILFKLNMSKENDKKLALVKDIQTHPVNEQMIHIDFYEVNMDRKLQVDVPIKLKGTPVGVEIYKGILETLYRSVTVLCFPMDIPNFVELDVTNLNIGESAHVSDITVLEGIEIMDSGEITVASVVGSGAGASSASSVSEEDEEEEQEA